MGRKRLLKAAPRKREAGISLNGLEAFPPIRCAHLLRKGRWSLLDLLRSLARADWDLPTLAPAWKVRDVAAHLLDTPLRKRLRENMGKKA